MILSSQVTIFLLQELYCLGTNESTVETSENKEYESMYSKMIPKEKIDLSKSVESQRHLYEKDVQHQAIKQVN